MIFTNDNSSSIDNLSDLTEEMITSANTPVVVRYKRVNLSNQLILLLNYNHNL